MVSASRRVWAGTLGMAAAIGVIASADRAVADSLPPLRSSPQNGVPACVTPPRMMAFLGQRNPQLAAKFSDIAEAYRDLGQAWQVRWDYAYFQMVLETNYLRFQRGDGSSGDVGLAQNNFAGVGATGGGVPGDRFPDVRTGVLAHIQHLVAYSGERVDRPVAARTRAFQGDIIEISRKLRRAVTFSDLSHRWAVDHAYGRNIETVAELYRKAYCRGTTAALPALHVPAPAAALRPSIAAAERPLIAMAAPSKLGAPLPPADGLTPPAPVQVQRKPSTLVRTIWRKGEPQLASGRERAKPIPAPVEVHREAAATAPFRIAAGPSEPIDPAHVSPSASAAHLMAPEPADHGADSGRVAGFAVAALAAGAAAPGNRPCRISAGEGAEGRIVLVRVTSAGEDQLTPVSTGAAARDATVAGIIAERMPGAEIVGVFDGYEPALAHARRLCPRG